MICVKCGNRYLLPENAKFCTRCGNPVENYPDRNNHKPLIEKVAHVSTSNNVVSK